MADDDSQPTGARNPARHEGIDLHPPAPPTPDSTRSDDNVGRRAEPVNGAVVGSGAGAGGGGGSEDFDHDPGGAAPLPNRAAEREAAGAERTGADRRRH